MLCPIWGFRAVDGKSSNSTAKLVDRLLARVVAGAGKVRAATLDMIVLDAISHEGLLYLPKCRLSIVLLRFFRVDAQGICNASWFLRSDVAPNSRLQVVCRSSRKKPCFLLKRKRVGSKAPFQVKISGTRMVAQKAVFAAYNGLKAHDIGTWQVEQSCCTMTRTWFFSVSAGVAATSAVAFVSPTVRSTLGHSMSKGDPCASAVGGGELGGFFFSFFPTGHNDTEWWCFEPSHLQRCVKDHVQPGIVKCGIPGPPQAILNS